MRGRGLALVAMVAGLGACEGGLKYVEVEEGDFAPEASRRVCDRIAAQAGQSEFFLSLTPVNEELEVWVEVVQEPDSLFYDGVTADDACASGLCFLFERDVTRNSVVVPDWPVPEEAILSICYLPADDEGRSLQGEADPG